MHEPDLAVSMRGTAGRHAGPAREAAHARFDILALLVITVIAALVLSVNPWPRDGWFTSQYFLIGRFPGEDNFTPIAAPAIFYWLIHQLANLADLDLRRELYLASLAQNALLFASSCLVYYSCRLVSARWVSAVVAIAFALFLLSTGLPQAFWSENITLFLFSAVLYLNLVIYSDAGSTASRFWRRALLSSLMIGLLVVTRITPVLLIPGLAILLFDRLGPKRLFAYTVVACSVTACVVFLMAVSNYARFGRMELSNATGRHLWAAVTPMVDSALAGSPEFAELKRLDPGIQGKGWGYVRLPNDERRAFDGEELLGRLAREAIRNEPVRFILLGAGKFVYTVAAPIYRLGFATHSSNPILLDTGGQPLPAIATSVPGVPSEAVDSVAGVIASIYAASRALYPVSIFFVLFTAAVRAGQGGRLPAVTAGAAPRPSMPPAALLCFYVLCGLALLGVVVAGNSQSGRMEGPIAVGLSAVLFVILLAVLAREIQIGIRAPARCPVENGIVYSFLAMMFFGSLWLCWQFEDSNTRYAVPCMPFLAVMTAMALTHWLGRYAHRCVAPDSDAAAGASRGPCRPSIP